MVEADQKDTVACLTTKVTILADSRKLDHLTSDVHNACRRSKLWQDQSSKQTPINSTQLTCSPTSDSPALNAAYAITSTGVILRKGLHAVTRNAKESTHSLVMVLVVITKSLSRKLGKVRS